jgi:hypothetical protein
MSIHFAVSCVLEDADHLVRSTDDRVSANEVLDDIGSCCAYTIIPRSRRF